MNFINKTSIIITNNFYAQKKKYLMGKNAYSKYCII